MGESGRLLAPVPLAKAGVVAYLVAVPGLGLVGALTAPEGSVLVPEVITSALALPLVLMVVWPAVHGGRQARSGATLLALVVIMAGSTAWAGIEAVPLYGMLGLAVLLVLPPVWAAVGFMLVVGAAATVSGVLGSLDLLVGNTLRATLALAPFVLVRLIVEVRRLDGVREALADEAVLQERLRVDEELRSTVGVELAAVAARAERAGRPGQEPEVVAAHLRDLVGAARRTLATARQMVSGFRRPSLRTELDTMVTLLRAAGIDARVRSPAEELPRSVEERVRASLRVATSRLLRGRDGQHYVITVSGDGEVSVSEDGEVSVSDRRGAAQEVNR